MRSSPPRSLFRVRPLRGPGIARFCLFLVGATSVLHAGAGWPAHHGDGNYGTAREGIALVEDLSKGKVAWQLDRHLGVSKTNAAKEGEFYGGSAGVVIADGIAYTTFIRPTGDTVNEVTFNRYYKLGDTPRSVSLIDADDVTVAVNVETGKELWVAEEKGKSMNFLFGKRGQSGVTPVIGNGMVFVWGGIGKIYAYDAKTGAKRWESDAGPFHKNALEAKTKALAAKTILDTYGESGKAFQSIRTGLILADKVLVAPDGYDGLIGIDAATGRELWRERAVLAKGVTPALWRNQGKIHLLCPRGVPDKGTYALLDSATGRTLWKHQVAGPANASIVIDGDIAILNTKGWGQSTKGPASHQERSGVFGGFQLSTSGAKQLWVMEDIRENWFEAKPDIGAIRRVVARDGVAYMVIGNVLNPENGQDMRRSYLVAVDMKTGKIRGRSKEPMEVFAGAPYLIEDRVIVQGNVGHSWDKVHLVQFKADTLEPMGKPFFPAQAGVFFITDYEIPIEWAWWKGRMVAKARSGLACIDFRK